MQQKLSILTKRLGVLDSSTATAEILVEDHSVCLNSSKSRHSSLSPNQCQSLGYNFIISRTSYSTSFIDKRTTNVNQIVRNSVTRQLRKQIFQRELSRDQVSKRRRAFATQLLLLTSKGKKNFGNVVSVQQGQVCSSNFGRRFRRRRASRESSLVESSSRSLTADFLDFVEISHVGLLGSKLFGLEELKIGFGSSSASSQRLRDRDQLSSSTISSPNESKGAQKRAPGSAASNSERPNHETSLVPQDIVDSEFERLQRLNQNTNPLEDIDLPVRSILPSCSPTLIDLGSDNDDDLEELLQCQSCKVLFSVINFTNHRLHCERSNSHQEVSDRQSSSSSSNSQSGTLLHCPTHSIPAQSERHAPTPFSKDISPLRGTLTLSTGVSPRRLATRSVHFEQAEVQPFDTSSPYRILRFPSRSSEQSRRISREPAPDVQLCSSPTQSSSSSRQLLTVGLTGEASDGRNHSEFQILDRIIPQPSTSSVGLPSETIIAGLTTARPRDSSGSCHTSTNVARRQFSFEEQLRPPLEQQDTALWQRELVNQSVPVPFVLTQDQLSRISQLSRTSMGSEFSSLGRLSSTHQRSRAQQHQASSSSINNSSNNSVDSNDVRLARTTSSPRSRLPSRLIRNDVAGDNLPRSISPSSTRLHRSRSSNEGSLHQQPNVSGSPTRQTYRCLQCHQIINVSEREDHTLAHRLQDSDDIEDTLGQAWLARGLLQVVPGTTSSGGRIQFSFGSGRNELIFSTGPPASDLDGDFEADFPPGLDRFNELLRQMQEGTFGPPVPLPPPGTPQDVINSLPISSFTPVTSETAEHRRSDEETCMVCLDNYIVSDSIRRLPCMHAFHVACIDEWLARSVLCPVCKSVVHPSLNETREQRPSPRRGSRPLRGGRERGGRGRYPTRPRGTGY